MEAFVCLWSRFADYLLICKFSFKNKITEMVLAQPGPYPHGFPCPGNNQLKMPVLLKKEGAGPQAKASR